MVGPVLLNGGSKEMVIDFFPLDGDIWQLLESFLVVISWKLESGETSYYHLLGMNSNKQYKAHENPKNLWTQNEKYWFKPSTYVLISMSSFLCNYELHAMD